MNKEQPEEFSTFEDYQKSIRDAEFEYWSQGLQRNRWSITHSDVESIHIQYGQEGAGAIADGVVHSTGWVFYFQETGTRSRANGALLDACSVFVIAPGHRFVIASSDQHDWFSVHVPKVLLIDSTDSLIEEHELSKQSRIVTLSQEQLSCAKETISKFRDNSVGPHGICQEKVVSTAWELLRKTGRHHKQMDQWPKGKWQLILTATRIIEAAPEMNPSVAEIVSSIPESERTLRSAFQEYFGLSPRDYILVRRLHECRKLLRSKDSTDSVTEIAMKYAFHDGGRFAGRYKIAFGELPSETIAKRKD